MKQSLKNWQADLSASIVVYLVALPLCLGIGLAATHVKGVEGLPNLYAGIIAGVVGGIVVGFISKSRLGVSGPAAGLITIVLSAIATLGSFEAFLVAVILSGIIQILAGFLKFGIIGNYFPTAVIKGMLAAIGLTLILKEIPHAFGYDADFFGDESFFQTDGHNTISELYFMMRSLHPGAILISILSLVLLLLFESKKLKKWSVFRVLPGAVIAVIFGIAANAVLLQFFPELAIGKKHLVQLPVLEGMQELSSFIHFPDFSFLMQPDVYVIAFTLALVGSLETLLSVEATDKLDPIKPRTPTNRELIAQGTGNVVSGLIGGLPITQVIVRSSANITAGGQSKKSTIIHGFLLAISVLFFPVFLNLIPLASLAAILILVGYKLSAFKLYKSQYQLGHEQFIPFVATIMGVLFSDLLIGISIGIAVSIFFILRKNYRNNFTIQTEEVKGRLQLVYTLSEEVTFLNKAGILSSLDKVPVNAKVIFDGRKCREIDFDVLRAINDFKDFRAPSKNIDIELIHIKAVQSPI